MRTDRVVNRNIARAIAGRTFNEKRMKQTVFYQGIKYGVQMERSRLLSSTASLTYEEVPTNEAISTNIPAGVAPDGTPSGMPVSGAVPTASGPTPIPA